MADHHRRQRPTDKAPAYPPKLINDGMAFFHEIQAGIKADPDVRRELTGLLIGLGMHGGDAAAVRSGAADLLRSRHPDLLRRFTAWIRSDDLEKAPAAALAFVKRVHETAGPVVHGRFLAVLSEAEAKRGMAADEVYDRARKVFGAAHVGLLHAFATAWLPGEQEWKLQQRRQARALAPRRRQRSRRRDAEAAAAAGMPDPKKKKPRAADADGGNNGRRHDHVMAVMDMGVREAKKRRRSDDDDGTGRGRHAQRRARPAPPPQVRDDGYDYGYAPPRSSAKKPRTGNGGELSGDAAAARVLGADNENKKPPRRRAASGGKGCSAGAAAAGAPKPADEDEVRRFRQEWEFQTWYSKLVTTSARVTELLLLLRSPHGGAGGARSVEALFPLPECREFLGNYYGDRWGNMTAALERGESHRVHALQAIARSLTAKEEEAVAEESRKRCRHDPVRVAQRLHGDTLHEECRRHHGGGA